MGSKIQIRSYFRRLHLLYKNMGIVRFFPVFIMVIVVPVACFISFYSGKDLSISEMQLRKFMMTFIPMFSFWWEILVIKEYVEAEGNELFLLTNKNEFSEMIISYLLYYIIDIIPLIIYTVLFKKSMLTFFLYQLVIGWFILSSVFLLTCIFRNITAPFMACLIYVIINTLISENIKFFPFYGNLLGYDFKIEMYAVYIPMLAVSVFFIIVGVLLRKKRLYFN